MISEQGLTANGNSILAKVDDPDADQGPQRRTSACHESKAPWNDFDHEQGFSLTNKLTEDQINQLLSELQAGRKLAAVKLYKEWTGSTLLEAKNYVESLPASPIGNSATFGPDLGDQEIDRILDAIQKGNKLEAVNLHKSSSGSSLKDSKEFVERLMRELGVDDRGKAGCSVVVLLARGIVTQDWSVDRFSMGTRTSIHPSLKCSSCRSLASIQSRCCCASICISRLPRMPAIQPTASGCYTTRAIRRLHQRSGVGIPLVIMRRCCSRTAFLNEETAFAATLRLSCVRSETHDSGTGEFRYRLDLYDPLRVESVQVGDSYQRIAYDLTAPIAYRLRDQSRGYLTNFFNPSAIDGEGELLMLEPYQRGKIPVVLIHGLLSDPFTWADLVNELRAQPGFVDRFQLWVYEYTTGEAFLSSAARLREQLLAARATFDPQQHDRQLCNMVLIGHSMGGLIAKLQVTSSGTRLWDSVARAPFENVCMPEEIRAELSSSFFFEPSPCVSRVVFMATPHFGSNHSTRCIGRIGSALVSQPAERVREHRDSIDCNPGVFSDEVQRRIPTSIDVLDPDSRVLAAIRSLPVAENVGLHSIFGDYHGAVSLAPSDGVVTVDSAQEPRAMTNHVVDAKHTDLNKHPSAIKEVIHILTRLNDAAVLRSECTHAFGTIDSAVIDRYDHPLNDPVPEKSGCLVDRDGAPLYRPYHVTHQPQCRQWTKRWVDHRKRIDTPVPTK